MAEIGHAVALARSTVAAFFNGTRRISRGNLGLLVKHLSGDVTHAETRRHKAILAWSAPTDQRGDAADDTWPTGDHARQPDRAEPSSDDKVGGWPTNVSARPGHQVDTTLVAGPCRMVFLAATR